MASAESRIVGPGHTFASVTDKIATLVLQKKTPLGWFAGFAVAFVVYAALMRGTPLVDLSPVPPVEPGSDSALPE